MLYATLVAQRSHVKYIKLHMVTDIKQDSPVVALRSVICVINSVIEFSFRTLTSHQIRYNDRTGSPHQPLDAELNVV